MGPLLLRRGEVPPPPEGYQGRVRDFYQGHLTAEELQEKRARLAADRTQDVEAGHNTKVTEGKIAEQNGSDSGIADSDVAANELPKKKSFVGPKPDAPMYSPRFLFWLLKFILLRGVDKDIVAEQKTDSVLSGDVEEINSKAPHYDNRTEFLYTFLQVMTASAAAFTHGANDVANAVGPYASVYQIWREGAIPGKKSEVPVWILAFGGAAIALGIWTYAYRIMSNLGNRITLMSPSRGFSMELGSVISVVIATRLSKFLCALVARFAQLTSCRAPCFHHPVHDWCHRRCWSLQRHLEGYQLAHGCLGLLWLDHHRAFGRPHVRNSHGHDHLCSQLGTGVRLRGTLCASSPLTPMVHVKRIGSFMSWIEI